MDPLPEFKSEPERQQWITDHATLFTVIRRQGRRYEREEFHTLAGAETYAEKIVARDANARLLIYAVYGVHDTYVKSY